MRIAFIGAAHWHLDLYLRPLLDMPGVEIVGVSDPDRIVTDALARRLGCEGDTDPRRLCRRVKPDFVIALGRHVDMPDEARFLIAERIPFAIEKPCGLDRRDVAEIAEAAERHGVFAAVPLVFRNGAFGGFLRDENARASFQMMSFRFIAGFPERYRRSGCAWMLDPALSGGGPVINLGVHFFDLCLTLLGRDVRVTTAMMSNAAFGERVEDHAVITLERDGAVAVIETGYLYPAPNGAFDMRFSVRSAATYIVVPDAETVEIIDNAGASRAWKTVTTNVPLYRDFTLDVLERVRTGQRPMASLSDMVPVMALVDDAYAKAGKSVFHSGRM